MESFKEIPKIQFEKRNEKVIISAEGKLLEPAELQSLKIALENTFAYYKEIGYDDKKIKEENLEKK